MTATDPADVAEHRLHMAVTAAERGQQKLAETNAIVSIAASLRQIATQLQPSAEPDDDLEQRLAARYEPSTD